MLLCLRDGREEAQDHQSVRREGLPTICWTLAYPSLIPLPDSNPASAKKLQLSSPSASFIHRQAKCKGQSSRVMQPFMLSSIPCRLPTFVFEAASLRLLW